MIYGATSGTGMYRRGIEEVQGKSEIRDGGHSARCQGVRGKFSQERRHLLRSRGHRERSLQVMTWRPVYIGAWAGARSRVGV